MSDIQTYLRQILDAVYGEEVRNSIHDAISTMNSDLESAIQDDMNPLAFKGNLGESGGTNNNLNNLIQTDQRGIWRLKGSTTYTNVPSDFDNSKQGYLVMYAFGESGQTATVIKQELYYFSDSGANAYINWSRVYLSGEWQDWHKSVDETFTTGMSKIDITFQKTGHIERDGSLSSNTVFYNSDYIECPGPGILCVMPRWQVETAGLAIYDENKLTIASYMYTKTAGEWYNIQLTEDAHYFRVSASNPNNFKAYKFNFEPFDGKLRRILHPGIDSSVNLLDSVEMFTGYINDSGNLIEDPHWRSTDYIDFNLGMDDLIIKFVCNYLGRSTGDSSGFFVRLYDSNKNVLWTKTFIKSSVGLEPGQVYYLSKYIGSSNYSIDTAYVRCSFSATHNFELYIPTRSPLLLSNTARTIENDVSIDYFDSLHIVPRYFLAGLTDRVLYDRIQSGRYSYLDDNNKVLACGNASENSLWTSQVKPIKLYSGESMHIKATTPIYIVMTIGDWYGVYPFENLAQGGGTAVNNYAIRPNDDGYIIINNPFNIGPLNVYISCPIGFDSADFTFWSAYINDPSGKPRVSVDQSVGTNELVYNVLNNALSIDRGSFSSDMFITPKKKHTFDKRLTKVYFTSGTDRRITLAIGLHDQREWFVASQTLEFNVKAGKNTIDLSKESVIVPAGYQVAVNVISGEQYLNHPTLAGNNFAYEHFASLSDITCTSFDLSVIPFFEYDYERVISSGGSVDPSENSSEKFFNHQILTAPNGTLYRLQLNNNLDIIKTKVIPVKYLAIGNSITQHGVSQAVNWQVDDRGMAATRVNLDYVHRLASYFASKDASFSLFRQVNCAFWETETSDRDSTFSSIDAFIDEQNDWDLITIQLGENASDTTTLQEDYISLIKHIKSKCPNAFVLMIGDCFRSSVKDEMKRYACKETYTPFVDLSEYTSASNFHSAMGTTIYKQDGTTFTVTNSGVAGHPGDNGFRIIAQEVLKVLLNDSSIELVD